MEGLENCVVRVLELVRTYDNEKRSCIEKLHLSEELKMSLLDDVAYQSSQNSIPRNTNKCKLIRKLWSALPTKGRISTGKQMAYEQIWTVYVGIYRCNKNEWQCLARENESWL